MFIQIYTYKYSYKYKQIIQTFLKDRYYFDCKCIGCVSGRTYFEYACDACRNYTVRIQKDVHYCELCDRQLPSDVLDRYISQAEEAEDLVSEAHTIFNQANFKQALKTIDK